MRSQPAAPPAYSREHALPSPNGPDRPETAVYKALKAGPGPIPGPRPRCRLPEGLHNNAASAFDSPLILLYWPIFRVTPVICLARQSFQFHAGSGKLGQDAILTGKP